MSKLKNQKRLDTRRVLRMICGSVAALAIVPTAAHAGVESVQPGPLEQAQIVGTQDHPMLVVPIEVPGWAAGIGVTGTERVYKGICGHNGAHISVNDLFRAAQRDLQGRGMNPRGTSTEIIGESPAFSVNYDTSDALFLAFYLPRVRDAAEYIDGQFDNRVVIGSSMSLDTFDGDVIGSAVSERYTIPWSVYVEGLRRQSRREDARFANGLPLESIPVTYNGSSSSTNETEVRVTAAQLRAVFGDNVVPPDSDVTITFNENAPWHFLGCGVPIPSGSLSLVDVAVHELTHAMGFTSDISEGGSNGNEQIQGLDIARFRPGNLPFTDELFRTNTRIGEAFTNEFHFYSSFPTGLTTQLESGDDNQPSHLAFISDPDDKLGVMDPVIDRGTTRCPNFYSANDIQPLDDMGWRPIAANNFGDCNGNGIQDFIDIGTGTSQDVDNDLIPDECESFSFGAGDPFTFSGVTRTVYETPGLTDLSFFDPMNQSFTPVSSEIVSDMDDSVNFSNNDTRVIIYEFSMFIPARDEYAFRVEHPDDMFLLIDNFIVGESERSGQLERSNSSTEISTQSFAQLEAGWHDVYLQVLSEDSEVDVQLVRESRSLGGWQDIPTNNLQVLNFSDCDANGQNDFLDRIGDLNSTINVGSIGQEDTPIRLDTCGSNFDTEIALWNSSGTLIAQNDDEDCDLQSSINTNLPSGNYVLAVSGFNTAFENNFIAFPVNTCTDSGSWVFNVDGTEIASGAVGNGRVRYIEFSIGQNDCDGDGTPDSEELDCNGDGIPDDCQLPEIGDAEVVGVIGDTSSPIVISTCFSDFDTEIAVWDESGTLISQNDDFCGLQSELSLDLEAGIYYAAVGGYNMAFSDGFGMDVNISGCTESGTLIIMLGSASGSNSMDPAEVLLFQFEVEEASAGCSPADLNMDGQLNFFDVSAFLSAYSSNDPVADFNDDGQLNFFDVSVFLMLYGQGCP